MASRRSDWQHDGQVVRDLREERGLTVIDLARRVGLSRQTIYDIEREKYPTRRVNLARIARALDVPLDQLRKTEVA
jgi:transcriptional regulator with XRE-family HTH domain